jgi:hypothetical protein
VPCHGRRSREPQAGREAACRRRCSGQQTRCRRPRSRRRSQAICRRCGKSTTRRPWPNRTAGPKCCGAAWWSLWAAMPPAGRGHAPRRSRARRPGPFPRRLASLIDWPGLVPGPFFLGRGIRRRRAASKARRRWRKVAAAATHMAVEAERASEAFHLGAAGLRRGLRRALRVRGRGAAVADHGGRSARVPGHGRRDRPGYGRCPRAGCRMAGTERQTSVSDACRRRPSCPAKRLIPRPRLRDRDRLAVTEPAILSHAYRLMGSPSAGSRRRE